MKTINDALRIKIESSRRGVKTLKWSEIYDNENELLSDLLKLNFKCYNYQLPRGYVYLQSFQEQVNNGKILTEKQMTQLKRLASSIAYTLYIA